MKKKKINDKKGMDFQMLFFAATLASFMLLTMAQFGGITGQAVLGEDYIGILEGEWKATEELIEDLGGDDCGEEIRGTYSWQVSQANEKVTITSPKHNLDGELIGNKLVLLGTIHSTGEDTNIQYTNIRVSPDCNSFSGTGTILFSDDEASCPGTAEISAVRTISSGCGLPTAVVIEPKTKTCVEDWRCTGWSKCLDGEEKRTCIDNNACGTESNKPALSKECTSKPAEVAAPVIEETKEPKESGRFMTLLPLIIGVGIGLLLIYLIVIYLKRKKIEKHVVSEMPAKPVVSEGLAIPAPVVEAVTEPTPIAKVPKGPSKFSQFIDAWKNKRAEKAAMKVKTTPNAYQPLYTPPPITATKTSNAKKYVKPIIFGIVGLAGVLLLGWLLLTTVGATTCEDASCFISEANDCNKATYEVTDDVGTFSYTSKKCVVTKTFVSASEGEDPEIAGLLEGKSMTCSYEKGDFDERLINSLYAGMEKCNGELSEIIAQLLAFV